MKEDQIRQILFNFSIESLLIAEEVYKKDGVFVYDCAKAQELLDKTVALLTKQN